MPAAEEVSRQEVGLPKQKGAAENLAPVRGSRHLKLAPFRAGEFEPTQARSPGPPSVNKSMYEA